MALQECVSFLTVMIILLSKVDDSQSFECGRIKINQTGNPGSWPWRVFIDVRGNIINNIEGSLITDQWVLTLANSIQNYPLSDIAVYLHSYEQLSSPNIYLPLANLTCDPGNKLCLLKLASPVTLTDQVQPICLASESSTFYAGTESWITRFSAAEESNLEIVGNNECQCSNGPLSEDTICAALKERKPTCLGSLGGPLMDKNDSVWVQSGVLTSETCREPTEVGVFVRVSEYQNWIRETVTGTPPIFVTFTSPDIDVDLFFTCFTDPTADPTADPTTDPTADPTTDPTADPTADPTTTPTCDSVFCGGESLIHFTHFTALCVLVVSLHVFIGSGGI